MQPGLATTAMVYECQRCGFSTPNLAHFHRHCTAKNQCQARSLEHEAPFDFEAYIKGKRGPKPFGSAGCAKQFASCSSLSHHRSKVCKAAAADAPAAAPAPVTVTNITNNNTTSNSTVNNITNIHIHAPVQFGQENYAFLMEEAYRSFMARCVRDPAGSLSNVVVKLYFNEAAPHNQNVCILNTSRAEFTCVGPSGDWEVRDARVLQQMAQ